MQKRRGRPPKKAKVFTGEEALKRMGIINQMPPEIKETLVTARRHMKGALTSIEQFLQPFTPKCQICYDNHGWIDRCECTNKDFSTPF